MSLYIVQYFINSVFSLEIVSDITFCVCVTHISRGRKKLCRQTERSVVVGLGQRFSKNQEMPACLVNISACVSLTKPVTKAVCLFPIALSVLCNYRPANLKGVLHAGRKSALGFSGEFVCYSPSISFPTYGYYSLSEFFTAGTCYFGMAFCRTNETLYVCNQYYCHASLAISSMACCSYFRNQYSLIKLN